MPPSPATAADNANRASFTRSGDTPDVAAATSDERTAAMLRPHGERLRLLINSIATSTITSSVSPMVRLLVRLSAPILRQEMCHPVLRLRYQFHWNKTLSPSRARASVASAS